MAITRSKSSNFFSTPCPELYDKNGLIDVLASVVVGCETVEIKSGITSKKSFLNRLPHLKECACLDSCFDRTQNSRRSDIESYIIQRTKKQFKKSTLNYLSLGSGFLLQDFIICAYLLLNGYSLCVRLIEPSCNKDDFKNAYQQFRCLQHYAECMQLQLKSEYFSSILEYGKKYPEEKIDVAHAIDFDTYYFSDDAKMDLHFARQKLGEKGFLYFSLVDTDLIFTLASYDRIKGVYHVQSGAAFFHASKNVKNTENEVANVMSDAPSYVIKNIVSYIGLFNMKSSIVTLDSSRNSSHSARRP